MTPYFITAKHSPKANLVHARGNLVRSETAKDALNLIFEEDRHSGFVSSVMHALARSVGNRKDRRKLGTLNASLDDYTNDGQCAHLDLPKHGRLIQYELYDVHSNEFWYAMESGSPRSIFQGFSTAADFLEAIEGPMLGQGAFNETLAKWIFDDRDMLELMQLDKLVLPKSACTERNLELIDFAKQLFIFREATDIANSCIQSARQEHRNSAMRI